MTADSDADAERPRSADDVPYGDGVFQFLGLLGAGIVVAVALLYGSLWLIFDAGR